MKHDMVVHVLMYSVVPFRAWYFMLLSTVDNKYIQDNSFMLSTVDNKYTSDD